MNNISHMITKFAAPGAAILGGLILLLSPDTATVLIAAVVGWAALALGLVLTLVALAGRQSLGAVIRGVAAIALGLWLTRSPMSLAAAFGKILGIALILGAFGGWRKSVTRGGRTIYLAEGLIGLVLLAAPLTASRVVYTVLGLILIAAGVVMLVNRIKDHDRLGPGGSKIIDV